MDSRGNIRVNLEIAIVDYITLLDLALSDLLKGDQHIFFRLLLGGLYRTCHDTIHEQIEIVTFSHWLVIQTH